jgi:hypothetical protein
MHVGARYYDAQVGRFLTRDTVLSEHPYLYCEHEPVNCVDPSGHQAAATGVIGGLLLIPGVGEAVAPFVIAGAVGAGIGYGIGKLVDYIRESREEQKLIERIFRDHTGRKMTPQEREKIHREIGRRKIPGGREKRHNPDLPPNEIKDIIEDLFPK